jgi:hypothetical protein
LIHWTGRDIDREHNPNWHESQHSKTSPAVGDLYLQRLRDILTYGLWMTESTVDKFPRAITVPPTPNVCFTELKLSESRKHAREYGRLGIGVKRPFVFNRFGRPLAYFGFGADSHQDIFLDACAKGLDDKRLLNFFKPMNKSRDLVYDFYGESEWRILFNERLLASGTIIDPRDSANTKHHEYFRSLAPERQSKLKYLLPLDGWFQMIIYPCIETKCAAQWDETNGIAAEIRRIKCNAGDRANKVERMRNTNRGNLPIEVNLDSCRHF